MGRTSTLTHEKNLSKLKWTYISDLKPLPPNLRSLIRRNHAREHVPSKKLKGTQQKMTAQFKMCHTPEKSLKHETFQKFSKLFSKTPVSNSTTKHTISTTPAMRLVGHKQESSLSHGSFEDLSTTLRQDRRQVTRKDVLTRQGQESLQMAHKHFCKTSGSSPDPVLLTVWEHYRKSSTSSI